MGSMHALPTKNRTNLVSASSTGLILAEGWTILTGEEEKRTREMDGLAS